MRRANVFRLIVAVMLVAGVISALTLLPIHDTLLAALIWIDELGGWGPVFLACLYVPACLLMLPASPITVAAGFLFGVPTGTLAASAGSVAGASLAFLTGRFLAHDLVQSRIKRSRRLDAVNRAVSRQGFKIVFIMRLSPVFPFNVLNYVLALSRVRFRDYVLASWLGMLPGTLMYVYLGSAAKSLADLVMGRFGGGIIDRALFLCGLLATVAITVYVARVATHALRTEMRRETEGTLRNG